MRRLTRKQLKTDKFAQDVGLTFSFLKEHREETIRYGLIALAVVLLEQATISITAIRTTPGKKR